MAVGIRRGVPARGIPVGRRGVTSPIQLEVRIGRTKVVPGAARGHAAALRRENARTAFRIAKAAATEARRLAPVDLGRLRDSIRPGVRLEGQRAVALVNAGAPYAAVMERGRRRGARMPPVAALVPWVRRKLGIADRRKARSVAFVVARKIRQRGLKARRFLERGLKSVRARGVTRRLHREGLLRWRARRFGIVG